jgi:UDP-N-acetylmuramate dehydrogenase
MTAIPLPPARGKIIENAPLAPYTWFRVGGAGGCPVPAS